MIRLSVILAVVMTACSSPAAIPGEDRETPQAAAFDVSAVRSNFESECEDPMIFDELLCEQIDIERMAVEDGTILIVRTTLSGTGMEDRAQVICEAVAGMHFDGDTGADLGFTTVGVRDREGENAAACTVAP